MADFKKHLSIHSLARKGIAAHFHSIPDDTAPMHQEEGIQAEDFIRMHHVQVRSSI